MQSHQESEFVGFSHFVCGVLMELGLILHNFVPFSVYFITGIFVYDQRSVCVCVCVDGVCKSAHVCGVPLSMKTQCGSQRLMTGILFYHFTTAFFETRSLTEPETCCFTWASWPLSLPGPACLLPAPCLCYRCPSSHLDLSAC